jgi:hypothetical protein
MICTSTFRKERRPDESSCLKENKLLLYYKVQQVNEFRGILGVCCEKHIEYRNRLCGQNDELFLLQQLTCCINYTSICYPTVYCQYNCILSVQLYTVSTTVYCQYNRILSVQPYIVSTTVYCQYNLYCQYNCILSVQLYIVSTTALRFSGFSRCFICIVPTAST